MAETVRETLVELGLDTNKPLDVQQDMAFLRDFRQAKESVQAKAILALVALLVSALGGAMWYGIKAALRSNP